MSYDIIICVYILVLILVMYSLNSGFLILVRGNLAQVSIFSPVFKVLEDNHIERLPVNLGKLQSLKVMTLDGNRITSLPDECKYSSLNE